MGLFIIILLGFILYSVYGASDTASKQSIDKPVINKTLYDIADSAPQPVISTPAISTPAASVAEPSEATITSDSVSTAVKKKFIPADEPYIIDKQGNKIYT